jgi:hypothetical protein
MALATPTLQKTPDEIRKATGVEVAALGRISFPYADIDATETNYILRVFRIGVEHLRKISPKIASDIARQEKLVLEVARIAKATFPIRKNYAFPSVTGFLGVAWLFPQAIKYVATPSKDFPAYTSYNVNSWDIPITAGTPAYIFGDGTNFYKTLNATDSRTFLLIFENGLIEYGSTPSAQQFRLISESKADYGIYTIEPLIEVPIESNLSIYQYPTPLGALLIDYNVGVMWGFMPYRTGVATIKLLGMVFYEHGFAPNLKWVA